MKEILCFGDSNTHGYMPGIGTRYPADIRWSGRLGRLLGNDYHVVEEGMDGRTTAFEDEIQPYRSALGYIDPCLKTHAPLDLIIIMLGTNDTKTRYNVSAEEIGFGMEELLLRLAERENQGGSEFGEVLQALQDGASHLVIGRPITKADEPREAVRKILEEIQGV